MISKECTITVHVGLHARPATEFAAIAKSAPIAISVGKVGQPQVKANSALRLLTLKAHEGETLVISFESDDEILVEEIFTKLLLTISE